MPTLTLVVQIGLYLLMAASVLAAIGVVTLPNLFHAALCLAAALLGVAGIYLALQADFLAVVQILLYVGAVMTLVIFTVMLTERLGDPAIRQHNSLPMSLAAFSGAVIFLVVLLRVIQYTPWPVKMGTPSRVSVQDLGSALMGPYVFPFEVISVILIAALIGAVIIAKRDRE